MEDQGTRMSIKDLGKNLVTLVGVGSIMGGLGLTLYSTIRSFEELGDMAHTGKPLPDFFIDAGQKIGYGRVAASTLANIACGIIGGIALYSIVIKGDSIFKGKD